MWGAWAAIAYGIVALVGGIIGYAKAKSKVSLISGGTSGILLIVGGIVALGGQTWGLVLAAAIAAGLIVTFIVRLIKTKKMMPAGAMIILGVAALTVMMFRLV